MATICLIINQDKEFNYRCTTHTCHLLCAESGDYTEITKSHQYVKENKVDWQRNLYFLRGGGNPDSLQWRLKVQL